MLFLSHTMNKVLKFKMNTSCSSVDACDTLSNDRISLSSCVRERSYPSLNCISDVTLPKNLAVINRNAMLINKHERANLQIGIDMALEITDQFPYNSIQKKSLLGISKTISEQCNRKKVQFGTATVREYGVTVGALSAARDSCPIQLTWEYTEDRSIPIVEKKESRSSCCRKLTLQERRNRIAAVQGISSETVPDLELQILLDQIQSSTDFYHKLLGPVLEQRETRCIDESEQKRSVSMAA